MFEKYFEFAEKTSAQYQRQLSDLSQTLEQTNKQLMKLEQILYQTLNHFAETDPVANRILTKVNNERKNYGNG